MNSPVLTSICGTCRIEKPLEAFSLSKQHKHRRTGRNSSCKECRNAPNRKRRAEKKAADPNYVLDRRGPLDEIYSEQTLSKLKCCIRCNIDKTGHEFYRTKQQKDGLIPYCKPCRSYMQVTRYWENDEYRESVRINGAIRNAIPEIKEKKAAYMIRWAMENSDRMALNKANRKAWVKRATPHWANMTDILQVYTETRRLSLITGIQYQVDHVVPLRNRKVCGLHVKENIRPLEKTLNNSKSNRFIEELGYVPPPGIELHPDYVYPSPY